MATAKEKAAKAAAAKAALETLAADGIQENEKAEATELVAELADLGKVEEVVLETPEEKSTEGAVAVKNIPMSPALDDVYVNSVYSVSQAVADILDEGFWEQSSTEVSGRDIDVIATIKYWVHQGHTNRMVAVV